MSQAQPDPGTTVPTIPTNALVMATNKSLADKNFRDSVRQMHAENYPLIDMVDALGLEEDMTARIREILETLPDDVIAGIRKATLDMLDSTVYVMPLDCTVTDGELKQGIPVDVEVLPEGGKQTIHVRPAVSD
jgi:hypothetical protein